MQLAVLGIPYLMILPTHQSRILRLDGLMGLLLKLPLIGSFLRYVAIRTLERRDRLYSLPNQYFKQMVSPELTGRFSPEVAARVFEQLMDTESYNAIVDRFKELAPTQDVCADIVNALING